MNKHIYTKEEDDFLINNVKGITLKELTERFNKTFNCNLSESAIGNRKFKLKITSGIVGGQFQKGNIPINKGKKQTEYMTKEAIERTKATRFKKGNIPHNHRLVGSERVNKDGYIEVKIAEPNKWQLKQRYIYESKYGKIPPKHNVIFLDGNKNNFDIDNLKCISNTEELIMNRNKLRYEDKDLTETGCLIAKIIHKQGKLKNERL